MPDPTHTLVKKPQMSLRDLADYMAASGQARRTLLRDCKYRPIARLIQHKEAKLAIAGWLVDRSGDTARLIAKAESIERRMFPDPFDEKVGKSNADYLRRFVVTYSPDMFDGFTIEAAGQLPAIMLNGVKVTFDPATYLSRVNRVNALKLGVSMLRYLKGKPLNPVAGQHQSAFMFAYLKANPWAENGESEKAMCITYDAQTGETHPAPGDSIYLYKEMAANSATIADAWDNIAPPAHAVIKGA